MGWARANMLFDRYQGIPDPGSPMEIVFLMLWKMRQESEFHRSRVVVMSLLNQEGAHPKYIEEAFKDLRSVFFPYEAGERETEVHQMKKVLDKELSRGPLVVKPMIDMTRESIKHRLSQGQAALMQRASMEKQGRLKRLDRDGIKEARTRRRRRPTASSNVLVPAVATARPTQIEGMVSKPAPSSTH